MVGTVQHQDHHCSDEASGARAVPRDPHGTGEEQGRDDAQGRQAQGEGFPETAKAIEELMAAKGIAESASR